MNVIARRQYEFAYYDSTVFYFVSFKEKFNFLFIQEHIKFQH